MPTLRQSNITSERDAAISVVLCPAYTIAILLWKAVVGLQAYAVSTFVINIIGRARYGNVSCLNIYHLFILITLKFVERLCFVSI